MGLRSWGAHVRNGSLVKRRGTLGVTATTTAASSGVGLEKRPPCMHSFFDSIPRHIHSGLILTCTSSPIDDSSRSFLIDRKSTHCTAALQPSSPPSLCVRVVRPQPGDSIAACQDAAGEDRSSRVPPRAAGGPRRRWRVGVVGARRVAPLHRCSVCIAVLLGACRQLWRQQQHHHHHQQQQQQ